MLAAVLGVLAVFAGQPAHGAEQTNLAAQQGAAAARPLIVAHRGLAKHAPENTLANFRACLELRLGIELDVRRTKDGHLVSVHDPSLDRTTDGKGKVGDFTLAELRKLDAGTRFDPAYQGERIATLDEIFALVARHAQGLIAVDLKEPGSEADLVKLAQTHGVLDRLLFIGLAINQPAVRRKLRQADAKSHTACLAEKPSDFAAALDAADADWVYVRYVPSAAEAAKVHAAGKRLFIAGPTVAGRETANWKQAASAGTDAILTDYPLELAEMLREGARGGR